MAVTLGDRSEASANNFDLIRFVLAASVCFTHSFNLLLGDNTDPLGVATGGAIGLGGTAVDMFFVISGFLVTKSWEQSRGLADFLIKRILRIYPAFLVVTLLCGVLFGPLATHDVRAYFAAFEPLRFVATSLRLDLPAIPATLPGVAFPNLINGSLWTIKYEFICYLLVAALGLASLLHRRAAVLVFFVASLGLLLAHPSFGTRALPHALGDLNIWPRFLTYFLAGMVAYLYRDRIPHSRWLLVACLAVTPAVILIAKLPHSVMPVLGAYLVFYAAFSRSLDLSRFGRRGDFSYGVYLYAFPVQQLLAFHFGGDLTWLSMFVLSLSITLGFAAASWYAVEAPCLRLKNGWRRLISSGRAPAARQSA